MSFLVYKTFKEPLLRWERLLSGDGNHDRGSDRVELGSPCRVSKRFGIIEVDLTLLQMASTLLCDVQG